MRRGRGSLLLWGALSLAMVGLSFAQTSYWLDLVFAAVGWAAAGVGWGWLIELRVRGRI